MDRGFADLVGETIVDVSGMEPGSGSVTIELESGWRVHLAHVQDCCEHVRLVDVAGDPADLLRSQVLLAEEVTSAEGEPPENPDSYTWTFYKLATVRGHVTLRWLGESNGFYSEGVSVIWEEPAEEPWPTYPEYVAEIVYGHRHRVQEPSAAPRVANHRWRWWVAFDWNDPSRQCWADRVGA